MEKKGTAAAPAPACGPAPDGTAPTMRANKYLVDRVRHFGLGARDAHNRLTMVLTALRDVLDELGKGDKLVIHTLGTFEVKLEAWRWIYIPYGMKKFVRSKPKRWRLEFTPCDELERHLHAQCPDEIVEYRPVPKPKGDA